MPTPPEWSENFTAFVAKWKQMSKNGEFADEYLADNPFGNFVLAERAESWDDFLRWIDELQRSWDFRGQREASWLLPVLDGKSHS